MNPNQPEIILRDNCICINGTRFYETPTIGELSKFFDCAPSSVFPQNYCCYSFGHLGLVVTLKHEWKDPILELSIRMGGSEEELVGYRESFLSPIEIFTGTLLFCPTKKDEIQLYEETPARTFADLGLKQVKPGIFVKKFSNYGVEFRTDSRGIIQVDIEFNS